MGGLSGCMNGSIIHTALIIALIVNAECRSLPSIDKDHRIEGHRAEITADLLVEDSGVSAETPLSLGDNNSMLLIERLRREIGTSAPLGTYLSSEAADSEDQRDLERSTATGQLCSLVGMKAGVETSCNKQLSVKWSPAERNDVANIIIYGTVNKIERITSIA